MWKVWQSLGVIFLWDFWPFLFVLKWSKQPINNTATWTNTHLCTADPVWKGLSAASCSAGRRWAACTSGSGRCEELWPSTATACPARWDGQCTTASWNAALGRGSNLTGSSVGHRDNDQETRVDEVTQPFWRVKQWSRVITDDQNTNISYLDFEWRVWSVCGLAANNN